MEVFLMYPPASMPGTETPIEYAIVAIIGVVAFIIALKYSKYPRCRAAAPRRTATAYAVPAGG